MFLIGVENFNMRLVILEATKKDSSGHNQLQYHQRQETYLLLMRVITELLNELQKETLFR